VGLVLNFTEIRTKEIAIRKISGASIFKILLLLNREIIIWIGLALAVGIPLTLYIIRKWLQEYVYRIDIHWWLFAASALVILIFTIFSTSFQTWRAATRNPADCLRYE
jgi:putative ABC transport system permease protein